MKIVVEPAALNKGFVLVRRAGLQEKRQQDHTQEQGLPFQTNRSGKNSQNVKITP